MKENLACQGGRGIDSSNICTNIEWKAVDPIVQHWSLRRTIASKDGGLVVPRLSQILVRIIIDEIDDKVGERVVFLLEEGERQAEESVWTAN